MTTGRKVRLWYEGIVAGVQLMPLTAERIRPQPKIIARSKTTGKLVRRTMVASSTLKPEKLTRVWMDEDGNIVPSHDVQYYKVEPESGKEVPVSPYEPTIGGDKLLKPITTIPLNKIDEYLLIKTYEVVPRTDDDNYLLYQIAQKIARTLQVPVYFAIFQKTFTPQFGIVTPSFNKNSYSMIMRIATEKVRPQHESEIPEGAPRKQKAPTLEIPDIF